MDSQRTPSQDAASDAAFPFQSAADPAGAGPSQRRVAWIDGHLPDLVEPLVPLHPETAFSETRRLRHDGWSPEKMRLFLSRLAECGVVKEACLAADMSARAAYNLRDRDALFAAGWEAACVMSRPRLADEAYARSINGVVERIYKDGAIVAERHRYDNRLTMSVLARLDARIDRAEERGDPHLRLVARWDAYLDALAEGRREDGLALLQPAEAQDRSDLRTNAGDDELRELHKAEQAGLDGGDADDGHDVWEERGAWWTDYPPPPGFEGEEYGCYGARDYKRQLSPEEQATIDADVAAENAEDLALAEARRNAYFGFSPAPAPAPDGDP